MKPSVHGSSVSVVPRGSSDAVQLLLEQSKKKTGWHLVTATRTHSCCVR